MVNKLAIWNHEQLGLKLTDGVDEVSLAQVADVYSRTYRSRVVTFAATADPVRTRSGLRIFPEEAATGWPSQQLTPSFQQEPAASAVNAALHGVQARYGMRTADLVAMQLEYRLPSGPARESF
jgi:hypothetical protein